MTKYSSYKSTDVQWFKKIPSHWKTSEIKHDLDFFTGWTPPTSRIELFEGDNIWVTITDMNKKFVSDSQTKLSDEAIIEANPPIVPKGALLYSFKLSIGKVAFAASDFYINEAIACFIPNPKFDLRFLAYAFQDYLHYNAKENIYGALLLNREIIKASKICYPKFEEQKLIADFLDIEVEKIDRLISNKITSEQKDERNIEDNFQVKLNEALSVMEKQIICLQQYRKSLIHEIITGSRKVIND